ncbi:hypothetical protein V1512DRAFT_209021 [Lipomyces arxii]|uniref:uncharacterized protein n=1 Tax=Lipomyces arxii TaxID=56418 RepID=UPI0034CF889F
MASSFLLNSESFVPEDESHTEGEDMHASRHHHFMSMLQPIMSAGSKSSGHTITIDSVEAEGDKIEDAHSSLEASKSGLLADKLMEVFGFPQREETVAEFPCYLLKSVLLQGHMFITQKHVAFFAYIPHKTNTTFMSGSLARKNRATARYSRFWCVIKDNVFSYFNSSTELYFPVGTIDLRYATGVELAHSETTAASAGTDPVSFIMTTQTKRYQFRADSYVSAKQWIKSLQRAIFRSHNDGDSVKIVIPSENIFDIEESPVLECADTVKIKVVDVNRDTYDMDEYFFSFFSNGDEAFKRLRETVKLVSISPRTVGELSETAIADDDDELSDTDVEQISQSVIFDKDHLHESIVDTTEFRGKQSRPSAPYLASIDDSAHPGRPKSRTRSRTPNATRRRSRSTAALDRDHVSPITRGRALSNASMSPLRTAASPLRALSHLHSRVKEMIVPSSPATASSSTSLSSAPSSPSTHSLAPPIQVTEPQSRDSSEMDMSDELVDVQPNSGMSGATTPHEGWSDWVRRRGRKVTSMLPNVSTGYVEKVGEMWSGNSKHFDGRIMPESEETVTAESEKESAERFRAHFALSDDEKLIASYYGYLHRAIPSYGKMYLGSSHFCFRSLLPGTKTKMVLPYEDVENVEKERGFRFGYSALVIMIHGHEEIFFEFRSADNRNDCTITLLRQLEEYRKTNAELRTHSLNPAESALLKSHKPSAEQQKLIRSHNIFGAATVILDGPQSQMDLVKVPAKLRFTCLTIGSRGDVQPYIALAKGLMADGHSVRIATHEEFGPWIESYGIEFRAIAGDPAVLMKISVEHGMFTYSFLKEASATLRGWITELLETAWIACEGTDVLIESPSAMAGIHIAQKLRIPYFRAFTMPWTRTRAYPHAFAVPEQKMGGSYNYITYVMFDNVFWKGVSGQVNKWRESTLKLPRTNLDKLQVNKVPFMYNFSPTVVPPPLDYPDWIKVTGYWFLDEGNADYKPDAKLMQFIADARRDNKKLVYIGFGSIVVASSRELTQAVVDSVVKADVRCILSKGWFDRLSDTDPHLPEIPLPTSIISIKAAPHDWLFPQVDAAIHHGGSGTTGASLRAGIPTVIKPFFGDQFFYANRVQDLGAGIHLRKLTVRQFHKALWEATHNERIVQRAKAIGEQIRKENGVQTAVQTIYEQLDYAQGVICHDSGDMSDKDESWYMVEKSPTASPRLA